MASIKVDPDLFADLLADRERLNLLVMKAARIMRRDGFTALRGTGWYDGEGVEEIQAEDARLRSHGISLGPCLDDGTDQGIIATCSHCGHVEHEPGDCARKRMAHDCAC